MALARLVSQLVPLFLFSKVTVAAPFSMSLVVSLFSALPTGVYFHDQFVSSVMV